MPGERTDLRWDRARHARCPERSTEDTGYTRGPHRHHRTNECTNASSSRSSRSPNRCWWHARRRRHGRRPTTRRFTGSCWGDGPFDLDPSRAPLAPSTSIRSLARDREAPGLDALIERNAILAIALGVRGTAAFVMAQFANRLCDRRLAGRLDYHKGFQVRRRAG